MKRRTVITAISVVVTALFFGACSNGGEGDRCDHLADNNGNDDCQNGLQCIRADAVNGSDRQSDRCCPTDRSTSAPGSVCALPMPSNGLGADAAIPAEAAVSDAPVVVPDAAPDAPADASDGG